MSQIVLKKGRIVDPSTNMDREGDLYLRDGKIIEPPKSDAGFEVIDCESKVVCPGFVDLYGCLPDPEAESIAAVAGGFVRVVTSFLHRRPVDRVAAMRDLMARASSSRCHVDVAGALTFGLAGKEIADLGLMIDAGARVLSNGIRNIENTAVLRNILEYAGRFHVPVFLRVSDRDLESGGLVREGPHAVLSGLPYIPPEAEEIGVQRVASLVRRTGTPVHLTRIWSARGVEAIRRAQGEGLNISASTTPFHLALPESIVEESRYSGFSRFFPPLGDAGDRLALAQAVADGTISAIASDHRPIPRHLKDVEFGLADPGSISFQTALPLVLSGLNGDVNCAVRALSTSPGALIGQAVQLTPGSSADVTVFDPKSTWSLDSETNRSQERNTPLWGTTLTGRVERVFVSGCSVFNTMC